MAGIGSIGYSQCKSDPRVFYKRQGTDFSIVTIVVDDMIHAASSKAMMQVFSSQLSKIYEMTHIGVPKFMIDIKISISS